MCIDPISLAFNILNTGTELVKFFYKSYKKSNEQLSIELAEILNTQPKNLRLFFKDPRVKESLKFKNSQDEKDIHFLFCKITKQEIGFEKFKENWDKVQNYIMQYISPEHAQAIISKNLNEIKQMLKELKNKGSKEHAQLEQQIATRFQDTDKKLESIDSKLSPKNNFTYNNSEFIKNFLKFTYDANGKKDKKDLEFLETKYVPPRMTELFTRESWGRNDADVRHEQNYFNITKNFLKTKKKYVVIGATFGIGKTSFAIDLARKLINLDPERNTKKIIPILVFPKSYKIKKNRSTFFIQNSLKNVIDTILKNPERRIVLIVDGLDESEEKVSDVIDTLHSYLDEFNKNYDQYDKTPGSIPPLKCIMTTRLESGYPHDLEIEDEKFVRLLPFSDTDVSTFFENYGKNINYDKLRDMHLSDEEICKPLFCKLFLEIYDDIKEINFEKWSSEMQKSYLYLKFIHSLLKGKTINEQDELFKTEKKILRKISALKQIYTSELTKGILIKELPYFYDENFFDSIPNDIDEQLEEVVSYFHIFREGSGKHENDKIADFVHKSFQEYLIAEYYLECVLEDKLHLLNIEIPNDSVPFEFLRGLVQLISHDKIPQRNEFLDTINHNLPSSGKQLKNKIESMARSYLKDLSIIIGSHKRKNSTKHTKKQKWHVLKYTDTVDLRYAWLHRWISTIILAALKSKNIQSDVSHLLNNTGHMIPSHMKFFADINLDKINLNRAHMDNAELTNATFNHAELSNIDLTNTNLNGAVLNHAKLNNSELKNCKFKKAELNFAELFHANLSHADLTSASLTNAELNNADLNGASFKHTNFTKATINDADLSDTEFYNTILINSEMNRSKLISAKIDQSDFTNAHLNESSLCGAQFSSVNMSNTELKDADLDDVGLFDTNLNESNLEGANLKNLSFDDSTTTVGIVLVSREGKSTYDYEQDLKKVLQKINKDFLNKIIFRDNPELKKFYDL